MIWAGMLARHYGLRPLFTPVPEGMSQGGVGGQSTIIANCQMPVCIAGIPGLMEFTITEDNGPDDHIPPLLPNSYFINTDASIESARDRMTLRACGSAVARLWRTENRVRQTTSLMAFNGQPWRLPKVLYNSFLKEFGGGPFRIRFR